MIVTVTANPSVDRTIDLPGPLVHGEVQRAERIRNQPGGKGINVARVVTEAGLASVAILPARPGDPLLTQLDDVQLDYRAVPIAAPVRVNLALVDPDGTTTKINETGAELTAATAQELEGLISDAAAGADWVALCGSLPPGLPSSWYADLTARLHERGLAVAVDTSGPPLVAVIEAQPDLCKPNAFELAELVGGDGAEIEAAAERGDLAPAVEGAQRLVERTGGVVLTTLGGAGALLTTASGTWAATPPRVQVRSTVGAGDASLAGYLIAERRGADEAERLRTAVAYGSAAAALPGTTPPTPDQLDLAGVQVRRLTL